MIKFDTNSFWGVMVSILSFVSFGAVSAYKITEHGRQLKKIHDKLEPDDNESRFVTFRDIGMAIRTNNVLFQERISRISVDLMEIKDTLKKGEEKRDAARLSRDVHMQALTAAVQKLIDTRV